LDELEELRVAPVLVGEVELTLATVVGTPRVEGGARNPLKLAVAAVEVGPVLDIMSDGELL
jgi:hypothetical protein